MIILWAALPVKLPVLDGVDVERGRLGGRADSLEWSSHGNDEHEVEGDIVVNR